MASYPAKVQDTLDTLALFPDRADRIQVLISLADRFRPLPEEIARRPYPESHRVKGCESEVFVWAVPRDDGTLDFHYAVENPQGVSAMALAVILGDLSGIPLREVAALSSDVVYEIFGNELSMGKSMGLMGMVNATAGLAREAASRA
jgi:cysteine desulfuration protein SufE